MTRDSYMLPKYNNPIDGCSQYKDLRWAHGIEWVEVHNEWLRSHSIVITLNAKYDLLQQMSRTQLFQELLLRTIVSFKRFLRNRRRFKNFLFLKHLKQASMLEPFKWAS